MAKRKQTGRYRVVVTVKQQSKVIGKQAAIALQKQTRTKIKGPGVTIKLVKV